MPKRLHSLTSRQLADSLGVSESSVKRWVDDGTIPADRTAGGHRRIPLAAAIRFVRRQRAPLVKASVLAVETSARVGAIDQGTVDELFDTLAHDRPLEARGIIVGRYVGGASIATIADDLIRPVMERLGELWHHDPEGILLEHRAVDVCVHTLAEIGRWIPPAPAWAPVAVTAGGPEDPYLLAPILANMALSECGLRACNLGPATPIETVALAIARYAASLLSLSVGTPPSPRAESAWLNLEKQASGAGVRIVVGGRCSGMLSPRILDRVRVCNSMTELDAYATGWREGVRRSTPKKGGIS